MGKENQPGQQDEQPLLAKLALILENFAVKPSEFSTDDITRSEFFKRIRETGKWVIPLAIFLGGPITVIAYLLKVESDRLENEKYRIRLSPEIEKELKLGANGEKLYFWGPRNVYWIRTRKGVVNFSNLTRGLFLAFNHEAFGKFLKEEKIMSENIGSINFMFMTANSFEGFDPKVEPYFIYIDEKIELAKAENEDFLRKKSFEVSAQVAAKLYLSDRKGKPEGDSLMVTEERKRLLGNFDPQKVPFLSLWQKIPE